MNTGHIIGKIRNPCKWLPLQFLKSFNGPFSIDLSKLKFLFNGILLITCLTFFTASHAQLGFELAGGPEHLSLGRATVSMKGLSSIFSNQAGLTYVNGFGIEVNALRRYNIQGLDIFSLGTALQVGDGAFGLTLAQYGFDTYREQKFALAYARKMSRDFSASLQFDVMNVRVAEFGNRLFFSFEAGLYTEISKTVHLGVHIFSPAGVSFDEEYNIPSRIRMGPKFILSPELDVYIEFEKIIDLAPALKLGIDYGFRESFSLRFGVIPTLSEYSFGFNYRFQNAMEIRGSASYDGLLGISSGFGFAFYKEDNP
ncbi:MAG TPA: hypothetical protein PKC30_10840 [Saprospiraceae bacterium]|nr:hypothetical protein [Saprospiraceae bacterium]